MIGAYTDLDDLMVKSTGISDAAMDALGKAQSEMGEAISDTAATTSKDIAAKFRFLAALIEDDEGGMLYLEPELLEAAVRDLATHRRDQWDGPRELFDALNEFYSRSLTQ